MQSYPVELRHFLLHFRYFGNGLSEDSDVFFTQVSICELAVCIRLWYVVNLNLRITFMFGCADR